MTVQAPEVEFAVIAPMLIVLGAAVGGVAVEAMKGRRDAVTGHVVLCAAALAAALLALIGSAGTGRRAMSGAIVVDGPALFAQGLILGIGLLALLLMAEGRLGGFSTHTSAPVQTAVFPLTMFAIAGMMLLPAAGDLLTMFIALEVFSLPLYVLCGLARRRRLLSHEAALKYFLLGAFSSALFLYGIALLYGAAGTLALADVAGAPSTPTLLVGIGLLVVGVLFKIGAVPFHSWIPDVYQGAPVAVTALMAAATKVAALGALLRIVIVALPDFRADWRPVLSVVAVLSMVLGAVFAVSQSDVRRMLGYSAVAQAGFLLLGVVSADSAGVAATLVYLAGYSVCVVGAFAVVGLVRSRGDDEVTEISRWGGLGRRSPAVGIAFCVFLLAFAGIPLTSGFVGKFAVFQAVAASGGAGLVVVGVLASAIAAVVYARVVLVMFFADAPDEAPAVVRPGVPSGIVITVAAAVTVALGVLPQPLLQLASDAARFTS